MLDPWLACLRSPRETSWHSNRTLSAASGDMGGKTCRSPSSTVKLVCRIYDGLQPADSCTIGSEPSMCEGVAASKKHQRMVIVSRAILALPPSRLVNAQPCWAGSPAKKKKIIQ